MLLRAASGATAKTLAKMKFLRTATNDDWVIDPNSIESQPPLYLIAPTRVISKNDSLKSTYN